MDFLNQKSNVKNQNVIQNLKIIDIYNKRATLHCQVQKETGL